MPAKPARAPLALPARQIDFADDSLADPALVVSIDHFTHELVAGRPAKTIITTLQLQIGVANPAIQQANGGESCRPPWPRLIAN